MLTRLATTLFFAEALEVWVVAATPERTRTTTNRLVTHGLSSRLELNHHQSQHTQDGAN